MKIENSIALVTGANRGIGLAFVRELLSAGADKVYAAVRSPDTVEALSDLDPVRVVPVPLDVTKADMVKVAASNFSDVNLLINNAGVAKFAGLISDGYGTAARDEMETNYFGALNVIRSFSPVLAANGGGAIVNMASIASLVNFPVLGSYSASKAAVHSMIQGVRAELASQGTQVIGVYPGPVDTRMAEQIPMEKASPSDVVKVIFEAVEQGLDDVFPDQTSSNLHAGLLGDPKAVEKEVGLMLPE